MILPVNKFGTIKSLVVVFPSAPFLLVCYDLPIDANLLLFKS